MERWSTFTVVIGSAAAGLTGLLFVAVSIRIDVIAKSQELRNRAEVPVDALAVELGTNRNAIYKTLFDARCR